MCPIGTAVFCIRLPISLSWLATSNVDDFHCLLEPMFDHFPASFNYPMSPSKLGLGGGGVGVVINLAVISKNRGGTFIYVD